MLNRLLTIILFLLIYGCNGGGDEFTLLRIQENKRNILETVLNDAGRQLDSLSEDVVLALFVNEHLHDNTEIGLLILDKREVDFFFSYFDESIYGYYVYDAKTVLVFGSSPDNYFYPTATNRYFDYIYRKNTSVSKVEEEPPVIFEPIANVYKIANDSIISIEQRYY